MWFKSSKNHRKHGASQINMQYDERGLELTTTSPAAAEALDEVLTQFLNYELAASKTLKTVLEADSGFVMGLVVRAYLLSMLETTAIRPKLVESHTAACAGAELATAREQAHVRAVGHVVKGDSMSATREWEAILAEHPHDLLALKMHHYTTFWTGRSRALRSVAAGVDHAWDESVPGYGYVLGMQAFGFEENGDLERAEDCGRRAVDLNPEDLWAIHAVAHVLESDGRSEEGAKWLDFPQDQFKSKNPFAGHLWWHRSLFELEQGNTETVLDLYDTAVKSASTDFYLDVQNMASLLKRLELVGVNVGDRWELLCDHAKGQIDDHALAFTDIHNLISLAAGGDFDSCDRMIESMREFANTPDNYAASTMIGSTVPLSKAIVAYEKENYGAAAAALDAIRHDIDNIGGSHAQRDLFTQMLIDASIKSERTHAARALLTERLTLRPGSPADWRRYSDVLNTLGDSDAAAEARAVAENQ